jgi:hypothetical protein
MVENVSLPSAFPHRDPAPCAGVHQTRVGQGEQLRLQRVVQLRAEIGGRPAERRPQIRTADVAYEQGVSSQDGVRLGGVAIEVEHCNRDGLGRMSRCLERLQPHASKFDTVAIMKGGEPIFGLRDRTQIDHGADAIAQLKMTRDEVSVQVRQQDVLDRQAALCGEREVLVDVPLRIHDGRDLSRLVTDQLRRVGEAPKIELFEEHRS